MSLKAFGSVILVTCSLAACGGTDERPEPIGFFATYIKDDGTKNFQYTMDSPFSQPRYVTRGGQTAGRNLLDQINQDLDIQLEKSLRETEFCRHGYRETGRVIEREMFFIRGQCKDLATEEDRTRFSDG